MKQWKRLAALSSAIVMAAATLTYFPNDTLQNIRLEISASAEDASAVTWTKTESDGLTWTLYEDGTLNISGTGEMRGYNAYSIKSPACDNSNIKNVVIEDGITSIGSFAFYGCSLTNIRIPGSVTSIGNCAIEDCMSLTSVTIPGSVSSIGEYAFRDCRNLTDATILDGVTSIENRAFWGCSSLTSVTIPNSVTNIGESAFWNCNKLTSVTIPDGVTSIEDLVFSSCYSLTSITIPNSVTSIGNRAFRSCTKLTSITIPDGVISIGNFAFSGCNELTSITIPDSVTSIGDSAFEECRILTSISIPDSVTSIGGNVFKNCTRLKTISLSCKSSLKKSDFGEQANLVSASHILKKTAAKAVTCTENGNKEYWTCEHCGKYFLSDDTNPETAKAVELSETVIPASHKLTKVEAKAPTCTEDGNKEYWTCEHCGKYFLSDDANPETAKAVEQSEFIIPALNHKNAIIQNASEPTETAPGYSGDRYCPDCDKVVEKGYTYWNEGNLTWKLYEDGTLNISGTGAMKDYNDDDNPSPVYQNSNVKKVVIEKGVTSIGNYAFSGCLGLKSITIPDGITSIGDHAFDSCINLRSITLPDSITSIGMWAFYNCWNVSSIIIPDGVTSIEDFTFNSCISLTSITIPNSVTNIKSSAFHNCADLTSITIPDSVTSIGDSAFSDCNSLQTISLGCGSALKKSDFGDQADLVSYTNQHLLTKTEAKAKTCTEDGNKEYWTCEHCGKYFLSDDTNPETAKAVEQSEFIIPASHKLTKVEAKDATCTEDGNKAYWTCEHCGKYFLSDDSNPETATAVELSETVIPALKHKNATTRGVVEPNGTKPGYSGDRYCPDCDTVLEKGYTYWNEGNLTWKLDADGTLTISGTGTMKDYDYNNNPSPANQKKGSVKKVVIKDGVTSIGNFAFYNCTSLTSITIPDSVTSIELAAFNNCNNLTSITIPDSVTSIGDSAFELCNKLSSITLSNNITSIGNWAFHGCHLTSITIPDSVTSIGAMAFYSCSNLQTISLSCKSSLKKSDFGDKANLVSYTNQHLLTKTAAKAATCSESGNKEYWTCEHCGKYFLSDDSNPETAKAVEQSETILPAIQHKNAELRNSSEPTETSPGYSGDLYCPDCDTVVEKGYTYWIEDNLTWKLYEDGTLNISGTGAMKDYDNDPSPACRNSNVKKVVIEDGVTSIGNKAFDSCSSLTSITIPNSVTNIGAAAFDSCGSLTSITIPGSVTSIGTVAFYNCSGLTSVTIPDSVTNIGAAAFDSCGSLTSIVIPNSVTSIESYAFSACSSLTSITIPDSVTSIGNNAFDSCSSLTSITIPDSVTSIGNNAFDSCSSLTSITIPDGVASIESYAFYNCSGLTSITIPDSVTNIGAAAFDSCTSLKTISLSCKSSLKRSDFGEQVNSVSYASHTLKKTEAKAATYAENGNKAYWTCEHCGKYFLSDDSNPETAKAVELSETVIPALVQIVTTTTPIKCVYGQDMNKIDMRDYVKNTDVVGEVTVKVATGSTLPDGMKLDNGKISGKPAKAYEDGKEVTFTFTAENGNTANLTLLFLVAKADPTVEVAVSGDSHTEGDLVSELKLILSENSTKGVVELVSEIKALVAGKNTLTWKFTPEDENNYNMVTGTVVVNAQTTTTTTTTTKATTTTSKATTTTKPNKTTTTKATTTTKPNKTTTTKVTTTTKPSKTTTTNATTTTKPNKTTTTKATTTTKPSKTTTTKVTTTTKPSKATTTKVTTTTTTTISSYGDVNLDGKVDIVDAIFLNKYLATLIQFSDAQVANADCYQDGVLNDQDTTALMQFIILLIDDLPVQPTEK